MATESSTAPSGPPAELVEASADEPKRDGDAADDKEDDALPRRSIQSIGSDELDDELDALEAEAATYGRSRPLRGRLDRLRGVMDGALDRLADYRPMLLGAVVVLLCLVLAIFVVRSFFISSGRASDNELDSSYSGNRNATRVYRTSTYNGVVRKGPDDDTRPVADVPNEEMTTCTYDSTDLARYSILGDGSEGPVLLAMNLYNNQNVLPTFLRELPRLIQVIGPHNVHVSIYENGSTDRTVELIGHLAWLLDSLGATFTVHAAGDSEQSHKEEGHRIHVLAALRNKLIAPLRDPDVVANSPFRTVLFMNDIQFCITDVLEVLLQKRMQRADMACAIDYNWDPPRFYDQWVTRTMDGFTLYAKKDWETNPMPTPFPKLPTEQSRYRELLPIQMYSCWNGIAAISAKAFLPPHNIEFRTSHDTSKHSECLLVCVDLWKQKLGRIVMAPRARVAYTVGDYNSAKKTGELKLEQWRETGAWDPAREQLLLTAEPPDKILVYEDGWWGDGAWVEPATI